MRGGRAFMGVAPQSSGVAPAAGRALFRPDGTAGRNRVPRRGVPLGGQTAGNVRIAHVSARRVWICALRKLQFYSAMRACLSFSVSRRVDF